MIDEKIVEKISSSIAATAAREFYERFEQDMPLLEQFCKKYGVQLVDVSYTEESTVGDDYVLEPLYIFDDNLGGYTRNGLENSLKEEEN